MYFWPIERDDQPAEHRGRSSEVKSLDNFDDLYIKDI